MAAETVGNTGTSPNNDKLEEGMLTQGEAVRKLQGIVVSGQDTMSTAEVVLALIDSPEEVKGLSSDKMAKYRDLWAKYMAKDEQVEMTADHAYDIIEEAKKGFEEIVKEIETEDDLYKRLFDEVQEFLFNPPFEGLDDQPYGLVEIAVFTLLEYFAHQKIDFDHEQYLENYRKSIAARTYEENANVHMAKNVNPLQKYFGEGLSKLEEGEDPDVGLALCCILALTNVKTPEMVPVIVDGSIGTARQIVSDIKEDFYVEGESDLADNVNRLMIFIRNTLKAIA